MRLIDIQPVLDYSHNKNIRACTVDLLEALPVVDAVLVVRCKDCKQYNTSGCSKGFGWCESMDRGVSDDFYCAYGAKMEDKPC